jgi:uncharacterized membrane protein
MKIKQSENNFRSTLRKIFRPPARRHDPMLVLNISIFNLTDGWSRTFSKQDAAEGSIVVNAPVSEVYQRWLTFDDYPKFITVIKRVRKLDPNHFVASLGFNGKQYDTTLEMMLRVQDRRLAWRTISNGRTPVHLASGVVSFLSQRDRTTRITLKLTSSFGGAVARRVDKYLRNFKKLTEQS